MSSIEIGALAIGAMVLLIIIGIPIAISLFITGFAGIAAIRGNIDLAGSIIAVSAYADIATYIFGTIPLFVLMGVVVSESSIGRETFHVANLFTRKLRGGLGVATVGANGIFAAVTGISIASAAVFARVAVPEMLRYNYDHRLSVGVVAGSSILGMMIPPSLLFIVYAMLTEESIGALFIAGIIPGLLIMIVYSGAIVLLGYWKPAYVGRAPDGQLLDIGTGLKDGEETPVRGSALILILPIVILISIVLGGIYTGIFSPTESGAAGAMAAILIVAFKGQLSWAKSKRILRETAYITTSICIIIAAASVYGKMLTFSGLPVYVSSTLSNSDMSFYAILFGYIFLIILVGLVLDSTSTLLIVVPLFLPMMQSIGVDLIWFGVVTVLAVEIGLVTPPVGISCFVLKSSLDDPRITLEKVFAGSAPFAALMFLVLLIIVFVPQTATVLVR